MSGPLIRALSQAVLTFALIVLGLSLWPDPAPSAWVVGAIGGVAAGLGVLVVRFWPRWPGGEPNGQEEGGEDARPHRHRRPLGWVVLMAASGALTVASAWMPGDPWGRIALGVAAIFLLALGGAAVAGGGADADEEAGAGRTGRGARVAALVMLIGITVMAALLGYGMGLADRVAEPTAEAPADSSDAGIKSFLQETL